MQNARIDRVLNSICQRGCRYVNTLLNDHKARRNCRELVQLDSAEKKTVLKELKSVMSVYDQTGSCGV